MTQKPVLPKMRNDVVGEVISDKMAKTITVKVSKLVGHRKYGRIRRRSSIFKAHDEKSQAKLGDIVRIYECRPMSRTKRWMLAEVIGRANRSEGVEI